MAKFEILHSKPRFSSLKMPNDEGLIGLEEAIAEGRSRMVEMAEKELEFRLIGQ